VADFVVSGQQVLSSPPEFGDLVGATKILITGEQRMSATRNGFYLKRLKKVTSSLPKNGLFLEQFPLNGHCSPKEKTTLLCGRCSIADLRAMPPAIMQAKGFLI